MFGEQLVGSLDRFLKIVVKVALLNFLWILFTLIGFVVAGVFPATTAIISVARKWIKDKELDEVFQTFKQAYKDEFVKANIIGLILTIMGAILYLNYHALLQLGDQIPVFVVFAYYFVIFLYSILVLWIFPLLSHYQSTIKQYFKNALIIGITKMPVTIAIGLTFFAVLYVSLSFPTMLLFCTVSLTAIATAFISLRVFEQIDNGETN
ncbi:YesL family protein [Gracilibacillus sp. HCP3S3_G5_1]|uniref:YesL family protein n=1 Tax=unclassified Gracilibacillus TaxID=2625209 RepID=UPI003F8AB87C